MPGASNVDREDKGCELHPLCSECPEPECVLVLGREPKTEVKRRKILEGTEQGKSVEELVTELGFSAKFIRNILTKEKQAK